MADRPSTFGGTWTRPKQDGRGHTLDELRDRASFDQDPPAGMSCAITAPIVLALAGGMWWALYEGGAALIGAIA